ncbi:AT hook containing transcription factor 1 homolog isoform X2 [Choristoneura fumiferana]
MQKLQDSVFSIVKTTNLSPAVFSYLQPSENSDNVPLGGILNDTRHGWLALGPKFCVVDLKTGLKVAARTFGVPFSNTNATITSVVELPTPLTEHSKQLVISLECEDLTGLICILHVNGSQILRCIQTDVVITEVAVCDGVPDGPLTCFDGVIMAGTKRGEIFAFDLNRASLIQALKDISQGYEHLVRMESNPANLAFLSLDALEQIEQHHDQATDNDDHLAIILNENSLVDGQYLFRNPDGSIRMKAKSDHIRVSSLQYIPQLASLAVGYNFGAFQIWNMMNLELEFASQVNRECLPVTRFGFQEPCDDPRAFCYLWAVFSVVERFEEEEFPLAVMYSLTYQGKRMLSDTKCLYQEFLMATIRFQVELSAIENAAQFLGGRCVSCHAYSVNSTLGEEGEDSMLNICQIVWECWGENVNSPTEYGMLLFDLDQWYKDQMPATYPLQSNAFMSASWCGQLWAGASRTLDVRLAPGSVAPYSHATRLEEHFYPNSIHYNCVCLNTSDSCVLSTIGIQRQIISSIDEIGPTALLNPPRLYNACVSAGLTPLYLDAFARNPSPEEQRRFLLSVALEARLSRFLKRCAHDWATGSHNGAGCTLPFLVDWCWRRALELKENAKDLTAPLFSSSSLPDRNVVRCLEHCVQQLTQLTGLLDAILTKCCNLVVPDALSEIEEKYKGVGTVSLYFQVVQWFLRVGLLPERHMDLPYPARQLHNTYSKRRLKLQRLQEASMPDTSTDGQSCSLLYIDQLIEHEFGGDRIHQMWIKGGSESNGLYPPPSLYSLLRLYLLPDIAEEHKHSLVLYLLVDYSMVYDEIRYEAVVRRLMQFPTMFGLSNTAIKATQAFWHLDHRDFDFALDQLQCLTGNTLSEWQHHVVLSSLLAQKKTQAALQYLHVRKPAPIQNLKNKDDTNNKVNDHDKLEDWQSCCNLYLARELVFEALDVVRMCVQNAGSLEDKLHVLNFFFKGCRNTGQLSKILQVTLLPFEEEAFIKYLEKCNEHQTSDILIMYYLQQARYLEAQQHNNKMKQSRGNDISLSAESLLDVVTRDNARDALVAAACASLPTIAAKVAIAATGDVQHEPHVIGPKPMSVFVKAKSPINTFVYKSSFIQDTIENASETWVNRPKMRRGIKRALNIEDTPFICTPKLSRTKSIFSDYQSDSTPPKRAKLNITGTPRTPKPQVGEPMSRQMASLLDMPEVQSPDGKMYDRSGAGTPHSILKIRRNSALGRDAPSPADSRYLGDSDDELLETASNHTHYSDSTNKHLRFTIPTASESGSTPSPQPAIAPYVVDVVQAREQYTAAGQKEMDDSVDSFVTTSSTHAMKDSHPFESPPKKLATEEKLAARKSYKDNVRGRRSLSISANSSLSDDPNTSIESIADIPITLVNPRYRQKETKDAVAHEGEKEISPPRTPQGRKGIRSTGAQSTPLVNRSRSVTPERVDSPIVTPLRTGRITRSRSRTPEISPRASPLAPILEQPKQETASEPHPATTLLSLPRRLRSRSRTPERIEKVAESPRLDPITESPTKSEAESPPRRALRSRSRTPEVEVEVPKSPRSLRSRSKTPEKLMSPKADRTGKGKRSLSRIVLEANAFAKTKLNVEKEPEDVTEKIEEKDPELMECTPMKPLKPVTNTIDVSFSPIINKSVLTADTSDKEIKSADSTTTNIQPLNLPKINETQFGKSVLKSCESSAGETPEKDIDRDELVNVKSLPAFTTMSESIFAKSVLHSYESSVAESSTSVVHEASVKDIKTKTVEVSTLSCKSVLRDESSLITNDSDVDDKGWKEDSSAKDIQKEKERIVEIEMEINEIEGDMSNESDSSDEEIVMRAEDTSSVESSDEDDGVGSLSEHDDEEIISIGDSSNDKTSSDSIELDEETSSDSNRLVIQAPATETHEKVSEAPTSNTETSKPETSEQSVDALNQGQVSLLTDDNSYISDNEMELNYSDEKNKDEKGKAESGVQHILNVDIIVEEMETADEKNEEVSIDPVSVDVVVEKVEAASEKKEVSADPISLDIIVEKVEDAHSKKEKVSSGSQSVDVVDNRTHIEKTLEVESTITKNDNGVSDEKKSLETKTTQEKLELKSAKEIEKPAAILEDNPVELPKKMEQDKPIEKDNSESRLRKRTKSTSSNKSSKEKMDVDTEQVETDDKVPETLKTPTTRKRAKSIASNKSEEVEVETPSKQRAKTPEVRKILTRRASREIELLEEGKVESPVTPQRRSTRTRSKNIDDNASVASEGSVKSTRSRTSEKSEPVRKGRKSIVAVKPELSAIPEMPVEDSKADISEYSSSRRLTRNQQSMLASLETKPQRVQRRRRTSASDSSVDDAPPAFDVQPIDRISLLNKEDFDGSPDSSEMYPESNGSIHSDNSKRMPRTSRAASESKTLPKAARAASRRVSADVVGDSERGSPAPGSPARPGRRASFNRACEALHTPKGRRASTDLRKDTDSQPGSPASEASGSVTPSRRPRRASNASATKSDTGKR